VDPDASERCTYGKIAPPRPPGGLTRLADVNPKMRLRKYVFKKSVAAVAIAVALMIGFAGVASAESASHVVSYERCWIPVH
jgi:hypothetical protein